MQLKIQTKKVVVDGKKFRKIISVQGLDVCSLPTEYLKGYPNVVYVSEGKFKLLEVRIKEGESLDLMQGKTFPESYFQKVYGLIKQSGDRLHEINIKINELRKEWHGKEDFEI